MTAAAQTGMTVVTGRRRAAKPGNRPSQWWIWLFLVPTVVLYGVFTLYPIIASYWYSLLDWNGFDTRVTFIGLQNFGAVLHDPLFWNSFRITAIFTAVTVPLRVLLGLGLALLLNHPKMPWKRLFRAAFFLPVVATTAIIGIVMQFIFDPASGPINQGLERLGLLHQGIDFLGSPSSALYTVMGVYTWKWLGITMIYWLAALQTIPPDIGEAARVDGASSWQALRRITLPLLKPFLVIITLLTLVDTLQVFDLVLGMTAGGPQYHTEVLELYIYRYAFGSSIPQLGYASAAAVLFGLIAAVLGALQVLGVRMARRGSAATA
ncbi:MAG: carbohydrate ABC transporter permease [Nakamurella sp.]